MAWNEPGDNKPKDPWSHEGGRGGKQSGPPDLDEALKQFQNKLRGIFGGGNSHQKNASGGNNGADVFNTISVIFGIIFSLWFLMGAYQLDEQEQAVVLRLGVFHEIVGSGFHWNPPIIDKVYKENVTKNRTHSSRGNMLTDDVNIVEITLSVQYKIADLKKYKLAIRDPELTLEEATDSALRHVVGSSNMDEILTIGREKVAVEVKARLIQYLDAYNTGINVIAVNVEKTQAPADVQASFDDVIKAREDEQRVQNEAQTYANQIVPESRGKASRILQDAQAYRDATIARAEGEAARFKKLLVEYKKAPVVTRERLYLDAMQQVMQTNTKVMVDVKGGNNMMYLPLDKLMQNSLPAEPGTTSNSNAASAKVPSQADIDALKQQIETLKSSINSSNTRRRETRQ